MPLIDNEHSRCIAAIDLGSNSFHMVVARVFDQHLQLVSRHKQKVRLGDGLARHKAGRFLCEVMSYSADASASLFLVRFHG